MPLLFKVLHGLMERGYEVSFSGETCLVTNSDFHQLISFGSDDYLWLLKNLAAIPADKGGSNANSKDKED